MKAPSLLVRKLWPRLEFFKRRSNFKVTRFNLACQAFQTKVHLLMASLQYDSNSRPSDHNACPLPIHVMSHAAGFPSSSLFVCLLATIHFSILFLCHAMSHFNENLHVASAWIYSNRSRSTLNRTVPVNRDANIRWDQIGAGGPGGSSLLVGLRAKSWLGGQGGFVPLKPTKICKLQASICM